MLILKKIKDFAEKYGLEMVCTTQVEDNPGTFDKNSDNIRYLIRLETSKAIGTTDSMKLYLTTDSMYGEVKLEDILYIIGTDMGYYLDDYGIGEYMDEFSIEYDEAKKIESGIRRNSSNFIAMLNEEIAQELFDIAIDY